jgi:hypothetical protein
MHTGLMARATQRQKPVSPVTKAPRYAAPDETASIPLAEALRRYGRSALDRRQTNFLKDGAIFYAGDLGVLEAPAVSIVGTREVSAEGRLRAEKLARELVAGGMVVVSGLARGVDTAALEGAIAAGGSVAAVIGTPLSKAYPAENAGLQQAIYRNHLLVSPFAEGSSIFKGNFPARNRVMAALSITVALSDDF